MEFTIYNLSGKKTKQKITHTFKQTNKFEKCHAMTVLHLVHFTGPRVFFKVSQIITAAALTPSFSAHSAVASELTQLT